MRTIAPMRSAPSGRRSDLRQRQTVDVDNTARRFDIELHQIDQRGAARDEANVRALLRGLERLPAATLAPGLAARLIAKVDHAPSSACTAHLLDGGDDVGVGTAAADVAAHQLRACPRRSGPHGSFSMATADMIWPDVQ